MNRTAEDPSAEAVHEVRCCAASAEGRPTSSKKRYQASAEGRPTSSKKRYQASAEDSAAEARSAEALPEVLCEASAEDTAAEDQSAEA